MSGTEIPQWLGEAVEHHREGRFPDAERLYRQILAADPETADAWYLLGALTEQCGRPVDALEYVDRALISDPDNSRYHYSRGIALQRLDRASEAADAYRKSLVQNPGHLPALENLAVALADTGEDEQGETICREVLDLEPGSLIAHRNLATLLIKRGNREDALQHLDFLLTENPADASAHAKRAQALMALGRFESGYADFAWRHHSADFFAQSEPKLLPLPSLGARDATGRKLVILPEQGVGDEILFAAGLPAVMVKASQVVLFADSRLLSLFKRSFAGLDVRPAASAKRCNWPDGVNSGWLRCEAGDIPRMAFGDDYPQPAAYLKPDPERVHYWRRQLGKLPGMTIGIAWRGGADTRARRARSLTLNDLTPLLDMPGASFVNLQYAAPDHDLTAEIDDFNAARKGHDSHARIVELDGLDTLNDLDDLAAVSVALDYVVTIDSAIAHLSAAAGANTCVLLPPGSDWRWFEARNDSPWYANAKVWRRTADQDWSTVVSAIIDSLDTATPGASLVDESTEVTQTVPSHNTATVRMPQRAGTVLLLNDTSAWYHWGCSGTSIALNEGLRSQQATVNSCALLRNLQPDQLPQSAEAFDSAALFKRFRRQHPWLIDAMQDASRIVINGEGSLHGLGEQALGLLYLAWLAAVRLQRPVEILNHSVYPLDAGVHDEGAAVSAYRKTYEQLQKIVVREPASQDVTAAMGIESILGFDCLPLFVQKHGPPRHKTGGRDKHIVIAGSVVLTNARIEQLAGTIDELQGHGYRISMLLGARGFPAADDAHFAAALFRAVSTEMDVLFARSEYEWLEHIGAARLLISGRFHHSIAAACMRTPFAVMNSNTPKITGMMQVLAELSGHADGFCVMDDASLQEAASHRLATPADFVLDDAALDQLRELSARNFR